MKKNPQRPLPHSTNTVKLVVVLMVFELRTTMVKPLLFWDSRCWSPGARESAMIKKWPVSLRQNFLGSVSSWSADGAVSRGGQEWMNEWMSEWVDEWMPHQAHLEWHLVNCVIQMLSPGSLDTSCLPWSVTVCPVLYYTPNPVTVQLTRLHSVNMGISPSVHGIIGL